MLSRKVNLFCKIEQKAKQKEVAEEVFKESYIPTFSNNKNPSKQNIHFNFSEDIDKEMLVTLPLPDEEDDEEMLKRAIAMSLDLNSTEL